MQNFIIKKEDEITLIKSELKDALSTK